MAASRGPDCTTVPDTSLLPPDAGVLRPSFVLVVPAAACLLGARLPDALAVAPLKAPGSLPVPLPATPCWAVPALTRFE